MEVSQDTTGGHSYDRLSGTGSGFFLGNSSAVEEICDSHSLEELGNLTAYCRFCERLNYSDLIARNLTDFCGGMPDHILPKSLMVIIQVFYALVCIVGLCGNTLVIYVVLRYSKMQTVTYIYILMLAVADEIFLVGIPFLIVTSVQREWIFGTAMCKVYLTTTSINQVRTENCHQITIQTNANGKLAMHFFANGRREIRYILIWETVWRQTLPSRGRFFATPMP